MDTDDDGLGDAEEMDDGSDPNDPDSDDDGFPDGMEKKGGTNPKNRHSRPDIARPSVAVNGEGIVVVVDTVEGVFFQIERCTNAEGAADDWAAVGAEFEGSGLPVEITLPRDGGEPSPGSQVSNIVLALLFLPIGLLPTQQALLRYGREVV